MAGSIHIGTSGWSYQHWRRAFYPEGLKPDGFLAFYQGRFDTVEINSSFYHLPKESTVERWREMAPPGFTYAVKASRLITHYRRLADLGDALSVFLARARLLRSSLGPVLFQLPPRFARDAARLSVFLEGLPTDVQATFEFRDPSWFADEVYDALQRRGAGFCLYDLAGRQSPLVLTAGLVYVRLHGPRRYAGSYGDDVLAAWAGRAREWAAQGREVRVYFDNDEAGYAALNAARLKELVAASE